jgi:hypothetical protein
LDLAVTLVLAAIYAAGEWIQAGSAALWERSRWRSLAAGVSISYVFVEVLPQLGTRRAELPYVVALLAFVVVYGLEHLVLPARERTRREPQGRFDVIYAIHAGGFAAYSALIGATSIEQTSRGAVSSILYGAAMALHFVIVDHSLEEAHGRAYARRGRSLLSASVLAGWLVTSVVQLPERIEDGCFAAIVGGVVMTSLRAEMPSGDRGRFWAFVSGAVGYALLIGLA